SSHEFYTLSLHDALPILASNVAPSMTTSKRTSPPGLTKSFLVTVCPACRKVILCDPAGIAALFTGQSSFTTSVPSTRTSICSSRSEEHTSELQSRFDLVC